MIFSQDRNELRSYFFTVWKKHQNGETLEQLEQIIAKVIELHPEYHAIFADQEAALGKEYLPEMGETNPFLHMSMHIAIHEQLSTDRPPGIRETYQQLVTKLGEPHKVEHQLMECLGEVMLQAQRYNKMPDEQLYLQLAKDLLKK